MLSLIQILAASFPKTSFLTPLFISPETPKETRDVAEAVQVSDMFESNFFEATAESQLSFPFSSSHN